MKDEICRVSSSTTTTVESGRIASENDVRRSELRATIPEDKIARFIIGEVSCPFCGAAKGEPCPIPTRSDNETKVRAPGSLNRDAAEQHAARVKAAGRLAVRRLVDGVRPIEGSSST